LDDWVHVRQYVPVLIKISVPIYAACEPC
jgi:hypothetical protein